MCYFDLYNEEIKRELCWDLSLTVRLNDILISRKKCYKPVCVGRLLEIISTGTINSASVCSCVTSQYNLLIEICVLGEGTV